MTPEQLAELEARNLGDPPATELEDDTDPAITNPEEELE